jgi:hypothetical protein
LRLESYTQHGCGDHRGQPTDNIFEKSLHMAMASAEDNSGSSESLKS